MTPLFLTDRGARHDSIWFFIGISLAVKWRVDHGAGIYQVVNPPADLGVVLFNCTPTCGGERCYS